MEKQIVVAALYQFKVVKDPEDYKIKLLNLCSRQKIKGTLLLGAEGINGTVAGSRDGIDNLNKKLALLGFDDLNYKESFCETVPFLRLKVKVKKEIVTIGDANVSPQKQVGEYVGSAKWDELLADPDVLVIDARNDYEVAIGKFEGAVNPNTKNFREFPAYVAKMHSDNKNKKIAMYCTGGIRCEKASAYMLDSGFKKVYHLQGGILQYIKDTDANKSKWHGDCFVFDERVALNHSLEPSDYRQCYGCRHPLSLQEWQDEVNVPGVCCVHCVDKTSDEQKQRYAQRQKQIDLAKLRGKKHFAS